MERWMKAVEAAPVEDEKKLSDRAAAVKAEIAAQWDAIGTRDDMLKHVEEWLAYGAAPAGVKGCVPREELYPIMEEVYKERFPEDFPVVEEAKPVEGGLGEEPIG